MDEDDYRWESNRCNEEALGEAEITDVQTGKPSKQFHSAIIQLLRSISGTSEAKKEKESRAASTFFCEQLIRKRWRVKIMFMFGWLIMTLRGRPGVL